MSMNLNLRDNQWIRWLGVASYSGMVLEAGRSGVVSIVPTLDLLPILGLGFLPSFVSVFTSLAKCF